MNNKSKEGFYKEHVKFIKEINDPKITEQELQDNLIYSSGAIAVYRIMVKFLIKKNWKDTKGYPLKKRFYVKNLLVCSVSIRKLAEGTGFSINKVQDKVKQLEKSGWIKTANSKVKGGQKVYILGYWKGKDKNYREYFYRYETLSPTETEKLTEKRVCFDGIYEKNDISIY